MIERLTRFVSVPSFHRGLALGALVGAAIAGSTLWSRIRDSRQAAAEPAKSANASKPPKLLSSAEAR